MGGFLLPPIVKWLKGLLEMFTNLLDKIRSFAPTVFFEKGFLKIFWEILRKLFVTEHLLKAHNYAEYELCF